MSWTYSDYPQGSPRDALRFKVGDTNGDDPLLTDAQCDNLLDESNDDVLKAAIAGCLALAAKFAAQKPSSVMDTENPPTDRAKVFLSLADKFRAEVEDREDEEEEEAEDSPPSPGFSSAALNRSRLFTRGIGYGSSDE